MKSESKDFYTLITGAGAGIGNALAVESAKRKRNLILVALPNEKLKEFSQSLAERYQIKTEFFEVDLSRKEAHLILYDWCQRNGFKVDTLINNAGVGMGDYFESFSHEHYEKMMYLNMISLVSLTRLFLTDMKNFPSASILNLGSLAGFHPSPYKSVYAATKSFVNMFSLALREELHKTKIRVSLLCPGSVPTNEEVKKRIPENAYLARIAVLSPERVARVALDKMDKGKSLIIPGFINKLYFFLGSITPAGLRTKFLARLFRKYYLT
ncbi:MAG: SDR family NAD(P)-dependent oxidoreductase [Candidatus Aminicenantes bacterium]